MTLDKTGVSRSLVMQLFKCVAAVVFILSKSSSYRLFSDGFFQMNESERLL